MKKTVLILLVLASAVALFAATGDYTSSRGTVDSEFDPNKQVEFVQQTSKTNKLVTIGTPDKSLYKAPIYVTSFGQSTDASMVDTCMKRIKVSYKYNAQASASDISGCKTLIIAVGASTKGLGAAGISEDAERKRAKAIMDVVAKEKIQVICVHVGGATRRGTLSDEFADMVLPKSSYIVLKEDANFDYKFTDFAQKNNVPISLIYTSSSLVDVFKDLLAK